IPTPLVRIRPTMRFRASAPRPSGLRSSTTGLLRNSSPSLDAASATRWSPPGKGFPSRAIAGLKSSCAEGNDRALRSASSDRPCSLDSARVDSNARVSAEPAPHQDREVVRWLGAGDESLHIALQCPDEGTCGCTAPMQPDHVL